MKWRYLLLRPRPRIGKPMRGRIHRIAIVQGGEVSVVVRFGMEEPQAKDLEQGALVDLSTIDMPNEEEPRG